MNTNNSIKTNQNAEEQANSAADQSTPTGTRPVTSAIPDYFQRGSVFGVLPVDDSNGELRTGISFKLESGEIVWLNLSCTDAEWLCVTLRSWMSDYETRKSAEFSSVTPEDAR